MVWLFWFSGWVDMGFPCLGLAFMLMGMGWVGSLFIVPTTDHQENSDEKKDDIFFHSIDPRTWMTSEFSISRI
jgi:hypothetical protein